MLTATVTWEGKRALRGETASGHAVLMDAAPAAGGEDRGPRPMEMALLVSILEKMRQPVTAMEVSLEGERAGEHPKVFTAIRVVFRLRGEGLDPAKVERAVRLSAERYCSVGNMLNKTASMEYAYEVNGVRFRLGDNPGEAAGEGT